MNGRMTDRMRPFCTLHGTTHCALRLVIALTLTLAAMLSRAEELLPESWVVDAYIEMRTQPGRAYPVFYVAERNCSSAELPADVKNRLSHRGKALQQLVASLRESGRG